MQTLHDIAKVYGYGKIATYIDVYADLFESLRDKNLKILEIGVYDGASMNWDAIRLPKFYKNLQLFDKIF